MKENTSQRKRVPSSSDCLGGVRVSEGIGFGWVPEVQDSNEVVKTWTRDDWELCLQVFSGRWSIRTSVLRHGATCDRAARSWCASTAFCRYVIPDHSKTSFYTGPVRVAKSSTGFPNMSWVVDY